MVDWYVVEFYVVGQVVVWIVVGVGDYCLQCFVGVEVVYVFEVGVSDYWYCVVVDYVLGFQVVECLYWQDVEWVGCMCGEQ